MAKVGRPRNIENPDDLLILWEEYKKHVNETPDKEEVVTVKGEVVERRMTRPYLKQGFMSFCFANYRISIKDYLDGSYKEFSGVVTHIRSEWEENQISGSITGKYKAANLVARLNGISDKQSIDIKSEQPLFGKKE